MKSGLIDLLNSIHKNWLGMFPMRLCLPSPCASTAHCFLLSSSSCLLAIDWWVTKPALCFSFPEWNFGKSNIVSCAFQSLWFVKWIWSHYDATKDKFGLQPCVLLPWRMGRWSSVETWRTLYSSLADLAIGKKQPVVLVSMRKQHTRLLLIWL